MRYKILSHTTDIRLKIYGADLEELLINGVYGLAKVLDEDIDKKVKFIRGYDLLEVESSDRAALVVDFLNEILTLSNMKKKVYPKVKVLRLSDTNLVAHVSGVGADGFDMDAKTVTRNEAEVIEADSGLAIDLVLDI